MNENRPLNTEEDALMGGTFEDGYDNSRTTVFPGFTVPGALESYFKDAAEREVPQDPDQPQTPKPA